ncbi:MAG: polyprenol monophosphomannose synthase [Candidatus Margulisbacteria bacterium]|nr:polyprenol monophosphomannose synthase [Candidatus Margulisiibacteriota bacterium]
MKEKALVIVPTYNEADNIKQLIEKILSLKKEVEIIVVDDNSPDGTGKIVDDLKNNERVHLLKREGKLGLGSAYMAGFRYGFNNNFEYMITMDADFSHPPEKIPELINKMDSVDVCVGSRYVKGGIIKNWGPLRRAISRGANLLAQVLLSSRIHDNTTGFRCYKADVVNEILNANVQSSGYSFLVEIAYLLQRKKYKIGEIPLVFIDRRYGSSKISRKEIIQSAKMLFKLWFLKMTRH